MPTLALPHRTRIASRTSVVQLEYSAETGPAPKPTGGSDAHWTRFVLLSDTHTRTCAVPDGDVLLHTGDLTQMGTLKELRTTMEWLYSLPHPWRRIIAGNHDSVVHREWYEANWQDLFLHRSNDEPEVCLVIELLKGPRAVAANVVYLEDEEYRFRAREGGKEWSVYGSPWSPNFGIWAFGYEREDGEALISKFPRTDILLTHGPPRNILDFTNTKDRAGCAALSARLPELKPKLHVFGHIHEARGAYLQRWKPGSEQLGVQNAIQLGIKIAGENIGLDGSAVEDEDSDYGDSDESVHGKDEDSDWDDSDDDDKNEGDDEPGLDSDESDSEFDDGVVVLDVPDEATDVTDEAEETVVVNAANWPSGPNARRTGIRVKMGGQGFQPIVVDMLE
ncbi:Metallo-dependent phosphatase-like protein [Mycena rosella]|uniref:Metallo-dependent phosphatase-like protein n=1 Tax=Mycena rosella TaxID=1033263 RepID=A0AAD7DSS4_MYCRO|nr:Metallo-dependent phosphatase-like protein [Mycena rosella]